MRHRITIRQAGAAIEVAGDEFVLERALAEGLAFPHLCRTGLCGTCKAMVLAGAFDLADHDRAALTDEEESLGRILACRARPRGDGEIAYVLRDGVPAHAVGTLAGRIVDLEPATHDITIMRLEVEAGGPMAFAPGQYASLAFPGAPARDFSMANRPGEPALEFHLRRVPGGALGDYLARHLRLGDRIGLEGPFGTAFLRENHCGPIVAAAGSTGLAPIKSIVDTALCLGRERDIHIYLGVRDEPDVYLEPHFAELARRHDGVTFDIVLSEPARPTRRRTGLVADAVSEDLDRPHGWSAYVAGPPVMVAATVAALERCGIAPGHCYADPFYSEAEKAGAVNVAPYA